MALICAGFVMEKPSGLLAVSVVLLMGAIAVVFPFPLRILLFPQPIQRVLAGTVQLEFRREINKPEIQTQLQARRTELMQLKLKQAELEQTNNAAEIARISQQIKQKDREIKDLLYQLYEPVGLTQKNVKNAFATPDKTNNWWNVAIEFDSEGAEKFAQLTKSVAGTGRAIGIFLNNELISSPIVDAQYAQTGIIGGRAVITGHFTAKSADELAVQLRGGNSAIP
jgi:preprotein translocase subunit SecD